MANQYLDLGMKPILDILREQGLIELQDRIGTLWVRCPVCTSFLLFDPESKSIDMLVICGDSECDWHTKLGPLREAVLKALHGNIQEK